MLQDAGAGQDRDMLLSALYDELRSGAARLLRREAPFLTLDPTELVNEAAVRVLGLQRMSFNDRQHFFATGSRILRQAMIDAIRRRRSEKRQAPTLLLSDGDDEGTEFDAEALHAALDALEQVEADMAKIVELRFFVGLGMAEIAAVMDLSERTVKRRWRTARLWLAAEMTS